MNKSAIYIHVPWCRRRCPYCDFYLVVGKPNNNFIEALIVEWEVRNKGWQQGPALSLYFGGGTPSLLEPHQIEMLIEHLRKKKALAEHAEITLEANPEDLDHAYAKSLSHTSVNRLSLGVQSFDDEVLRFLGRKHSQAMASRAIENLLSAGFHNLSVDLIIGTAKEKPKNTTDSLKYLHETGIPHISAYLLTIEERTKFFKQIKTGLMGAPDEDVQVEAYRRVQDGLLDLGYLQYDISSYALCGFLSRHNQVYWGSGNYIGLGPGAHSMRFLEDGGIERAHDRASISQWLSDPGNGSNFSIDRLTPKEALHESLAFGLRNMDIGIRPADLFLRHNSENPAMFLVLKNFKDFGWLEEISGAFLITREGALFADAIMREILCC